MLLLLTLTVILISILIVKFLIPIFVRHSQLKKDYQNISILPCSSIPFVGNAHQLSQQPYLVCRLFQQLARECQDQDKGAFCLWFALWPMIVLCSAKGLETFINNSKQLVKPFDYTLLEPWLKTGLLTSKNEKWRSRRRLITPSFHDTQLLHNFVNIFNEQSSILAQRFDEFARQSELTHDLHPHISACTLDIIAEAATGVRLQAQKDAEKNEVVAATIRMGHIMCTRSLNPHLWSNFIFNQLPIGREQKKALRVLHGFSRKIIEERLASFNLQETAENNDRSSRRRLVFLDSLLTQMHQEKLTLDDIQEEVDTFMFEGHDTTAAAITFFCYLMGCHPDVQAKVHAELDSIFGDDRERACTIEDIEQMTYLDCVIKESMRVLPPVPAIGREAQEDFIYQNQTVRKGNTVLIYIYGIHHDPNVYPNPEKFDPERFANNPLVSDERSPFAFIPFSAGSRNCIGQRFAGLEERVVLSTLFRQFSFRSTQTIDELHLAGDVVLRTRVPIKMHVERRYSLHSSNKHS